MDPLFLDRLTQVIERVAEGEHTDDIMEFTKDAYPPEIRRIAEAVGMMLVKVESREFKMGQLIHELREANARLKSGILQTVSAMADALGARDEHTKGHALRVSIYAQRLARAVKAPESEVETIALAGKLHDIGKISFSDELLTNEDTMPTPSMLAEIRSHPEVGADILQQLEFFEDALQYVLGHHERLDGKGYPQGLKGEQIPLGTRIVSVADVFDALTTDRSYQKGKTLEEAFAILRKLAGPSLDPELVELFIANIEEHGKVAWPPPGPGIAVE